MAGARHVFIGNLAWTVTSETLLSFSRQVDGVIHAEVKRHEGSKRSKGWGLLECTDPESARVAAELLNMRELMGRPVHARLDRTHLEKEDGMTNVFVGNLAWNITERELSERFAHFNPSDCSVLTNQYGRSRGFGILKFGDLSAAQNFISSANGLEIAGRVIECRLDAGPVRKRDASSESGTSLFVGKLPAAVNDETLYSLFAPFGQVVAARVSLSSEGFSKGWGIVTYASTDHARAAQQSMNGASIPGLDAPGAVSLLEVRFDRKG